MSHFEVARAMEQSLIQMLVTCLTTAPARGDGQVKRRHARIMVRFEEVLAEDLGRPLRMPELCALVAVGDRTLRLERDSNGPGAARALWPGPIRHAVLLAIRGPDPAAPSTHCSGSATLARVNLSPRRDKAQDRVPF